MGRKLRGAALRAKKRADAVGIEMMKDQAHDTERASIRKKSNDELFVMDTQGYVDNNTQDIYHPKYRASYNNHNKRKHPNEEEEPNNKNNKNNKNKNGNKKQRKNKHEFSPLEQAKIQKMILVQQQQQQQQQPQNKNNKKNKKNPTTTTKKKEAFDLWGGDNNNMNAKDTTTGSTRKNVVEEKKNHKKKNQQQPQQPQQQQPQQQAQEKDVAVTNVSVEVAHGGQSYRPDPKQHEELIREAFHVEIRRQEAQKKQTTFLSQGLSEETKALLIVHSDDSDSDSDSDSNSDSDKQEEDNNNNDTTTMDHSSLSPPQQKKIPNRGDKLTRAQRNKQKRQKQREFVWEQQRKEKKFIKSVGNIHRVMKQIQNDEIHRQEKKQTIQEQKQQTQQLNGIPGTKLFQKLSKQDPIHAPTFPIALAQELQQQEQQEQRLKMQQQEQQQKEQQKEQKEQQQQQQQQQQEQEQQEQQEQKEQKEQQQNQSSSLSSSSSSSLRTMKPKGNLLTERMASYADRKMIAQRKFGDQQQRKHQQSSKRKLLVRPAKVVE